MTFDLTRRGLVAGAAALLPTAAFGQAKAQLAPLTSILTGRTYGPDAPPVRMICSTISRPRTKSAVRNGLAMHASPSELVSPVWFT